MGSQESFDYRSINRMPTALGIERRLCIVGIMLAMIRFQLGGGLIECLVEFLVYWGIVLALSQWEPRIIQMLPDLWQQKRFYNASKFVR